MHGRGKKYNNQSELEFDGEFIFGNKKKGKEYLKCKLEFEGEYKKGKKMGWKRV